MNRTVTIIGVASLCLIAAALVVWRMGAASGAGVAPVADPTDLMFSDQEGPAALWMEISMILLLLGAAGGIATLKYWFRNRNELKGFARRGTGIVPR